MSLPLCAISVTTADGKSDEVSYAKFKTKKKKSGSEVVMHFCNPSIFEVEDQWFKIILGL